MTDKSNYVAGTFWIIASIAFTVFWLTHISPQTINRNDLQALSGTLKTIPKKEKGAKGEMGASFELNEYDNTTFGISSGLYAIIKTELFKVAKPNDTVSFFIDKDLYFKRLTQPYDNNIINNFPYGEHIPFYDLTLHGKNYLPIDDFNKKQVKENWWKNVFYVVLLFLMLTQVYAFMTKKKASSQQ